MPQCEMNASTAGENTQALSRNSLDMDMGAGGNWTTAGAPAHSIPLRMMVRRLASLSDDGAGLGWLLINCLWLLPVVT